MFRLFTNDKALLWCLLVQLLVLIEANKADKQGPSDLCFDSEFGRGIVAASTSESRKDVREVELSSVLSLYQGCCGSSVPCRQSGGLCLPSWLDVFLPCLIKGLCGENCTCFLPKNKCSSPCGHSCGDSGTCREKCQDLEVKASYNCGTNPGCHCCVRCSGICSSSKGQCKTSCDLKKEKDVGSCNSRSSCRCCEPKATGCPNNNIPCGINGYCGENCRYTTPPDELHRPSSRLVSQCPDNCSCCDDYWLPLPSPPIA